MLTLQVRMLGDFDDMLTSGVFLFDTNSGFIKEQEVVVMVLMGTIAVVSSHNIKSNLECVSPSHSMRLQDDSRLNGQVAIPSPSMSAVFVSLFDEAASTRDIIVKAGEVKIHAHKIVLIAQSALFRAMFQVR